MKKRKLVLSSRAKDDLIEIWLYIAADSPAVADKFIDYLYEQCEHLCSTPKLGRKRDELVPHIRSLSVKKYSVFYKITNQNIEVARILSGYRDIESLF